MTEPRYPLQVVFELVDLAAGMVAARHRREHAEATQADIDAAVRTWLRDRPGAPHGDAVGRSVPWPRPARASAGGPVTPGS